MDADRVFLGGFEFGRDVLAWLYQGGSRILLNSWSQVTPDRREHDWIARDIDRFVVANQDAFVISAVGTDGPLSSGALSKVSRSRPRRHRCRC
jgi:hypothetical protein